MDRYKFPYRGLSFPKGPMMMLHFYILLIVILVHIHLASPLQGVRYSLC